MPPATQVRSKADATNKNIMADLMDLAGQLSLSSQGNNTNPNQQSQNRKYGVTMDKTISHAYYQRAEIKDTSIPSVLKQKILDACEPLNTPPTGKVIMRLEQKFVTKPYRQVIEEKEARKREIQISGFNADPKEPYRSLGPPILDSQKLMLHTLQVENENREQKILSGSQRGSAAPSLTKLDENVSTNSEDKSGAVQAKSATEPILPSTNFSRFNNGFDLIKNRLVQAQERIDFVKIGVPIAFIYEQERERLIKTAEKKQAEDDAKKPIRRDQSTEKLLDATSGRGIDTDKLSRINFGEEGWMFRLEHLQNRGRKTNFYENADSHSKKLQVDEDRFHFFMGLHDKFLSTHTEKTENERAKTSVAVKRPSSEEKADESRKTPSTQETQQTKIFAKKSGVTYQKQKYSVDVLEAALGIHRADRAAHSESKDAGTTSFTNSPGASNDTGATVNTRTMTPEKRIEETTRQFYMHRNTLSNALVDTLHKHDMDRVSSYRRKFASFRITTGAGAADDLAMMRHRAHQAKLEQRLKALKDVPGYEDVFTAMMMVEEVSRGRLMVGNINNDAKWRLYVRGEKEQKLMKRIKKLIELDTPMTKTIFVKLLKMIPPNDFPQEHIQKIFRFLKNNLFKLTERDFLELVVKNGYSCEAQDDHLPILESATTSSLSTPPTNSTKRASQQTQKATPAASLPGSKPISIDALSVANEKDGVKSDPENDENEDT